LLAACIIRAYYSQKIGERQLSLAQQSENDEMLSPLVTAQIWGALSLGLSYEEKLQAHNFASKFSKMD
jgi:hypothetical protein